MELSSDGDNDSHRVPSEDIDMDDRSEVDGDTAARGPPTTSHDDSASEVVSDLEEHKRKNGPRQPSEQLSMSSMGS